MTTDTNTRPESPSGAARRAPVVLRAVSAIERAGLVLAGSVLMAMTLLMVFETGMRYFVGAPLGWSFSFIQDYLLPGFFFLALAYTVRAGAHVTIDAVYQRCPAKVQTAMTLVARVLMLGFSVLLLWAGMLSTGHAWRAHDIPPPGGAELSIPTWTWHVLVPIGAALLTVRLLWDVFTGHRRGAGDETEGNA
ncbi:MULTISPECIES: TRAP transporter small permease [Prauserella salsuginis group]|uniref:TRAP-type C4-dicarboxylate transport system permease small subunit n=2 Tax=Prauserella salsuginis group TaxID=2893672 RepID=A0A839XIZ9_9PSEU|nr:MULTISPECIES: TRAP transporter small permease [Prauserella salsuginis group]MBB3661729.1 TRAP-type C4-dicarboxylate transport system permease small subunit [Prauserella sediminis]MCR3719640.1 TRAP-type C4-dicarboxylate transport system, small permease component [Prauserella flava]MCR3735346.1 TRAP-type C4-dicarboxylate transport system, small permease component [Prauserella salsuginis]